VLGIAQLKPSGLARRRPPALRSCKHHGTRRRTASPRPRWAAIEETDTSGWPTSIGWQYGAAYQ
jgi:hypothetical protein